MRIYRTHIVKEFLRNGPSSFEQLTKVHEVISSDNSDSPSKYVKESYDGRLEEISEKEFEKLNKNKF